MRVIAGIFKGKKILEPKNSKTRPLKDLAKESIFNILIHSNKFQFELKNSEVLDLFSGVGSFGIECLSRGVKNVVFVENYYEVLPILKKNLENLKKIKNYQILESNIYEKKFFQKIDKRFDIIFFDPPFKDKNLSILLNSIKNQNIINKNGIIIIHRHKDELDVIPKQFRIIEEKKYGLSKIVFFQF